MCDVGLLGVDNGVSGGFGTVLVGRIWGRGRGCYLVLVINVGHRKGLIVDIVDVSLCNILLL